MSDTQQLTEISNAIRFKSHRMTQANQLEMLFDYSILVALIMDKQVHPKRKFYKDSVKRLKVLPAQIKHLIRANQKSRRLKYDEKMELLRIRSSIIHMANWAIEAIRLPYVYATM